MGTLRNSSLMIATLMIFHPTSTSSPPMLFLFPNLPTIASMIATTAASEVPDPTSTLLIFLAHTSALRLPTETTMTHPLMDLARELPMLNLTSRAMATTDTLNATVESCQLRTTMLKSMVIASLAIATMNPTISTTTATPTMNSSQGLSFLKRPTPSLTKSHTPSPPKSQGPSTLMSLTPLMLRF